MALAVSVRRALVNETIYTVKLRHRGHRIPKERHINLYLVRQAQDIMERQFVVAAAGTTLKQTMSAENIDNACAVVVEREGRIAGLIPPRSGLWVESQLNPNLTVESFAEKRLVICRDRDLLGLVFARVEAPPRRRRNRVPRRFPPVCRRHCRNRHQACHRRRGDRQLRGLTSARNNPSRQRSVSPSARGSRIFVERASLAPQLSHGQRAEQTPARRSQIGAVDPLRYRLRLEFGAAHA